MHAVTLEELAEISRRIALAIVASFRLDCSSVALDMTNCATFIDTGNGRAPIASAARPSRNAPTCGWSGWAWWSPGTAGSR